MPLSHEGNTWNTGQKWGTKFRASCRFLTASLFLERPGNFSDHKTKFKSKPVRIVAQLLAHKPVSFASFTNSFIVLFSKLLKLWSWNSFQRPKSYRDFREKALGRRQIGNTWNRGDTERHLNLTWIPRVCKSVYISLLRYFSLLPFISVKQYRVNIAIGSFLRT